VEIPLEINHPVEGIVAAAMFLKVMIVTTRKRRRKKRRNHCSYSAKYERIVCTHSVPKIPIDE
jgi:hypothetical protein